MARTTLLAFVAVFLIVPATLRGDDLFVDHLGNAPFGLPGAIHSRGVLGLPDRYELQEVRLHVINLKTRKKKTYPVPNNKLKIERQLGHWDFKIATDKGNYRVFVVMKVKEKNTKMTEDIVTDLADVTVPAPEKK